MNQFQKKRVEGAIKKINLSYDGVYTLSLTPEGKFKLNDTKGVGKFLETNIGRISNYSEFEIFAMLYYEIYDSYSNGSLTDETKPEFVGKNLKDGKDELFAKKVEQMFENYLTAFFENHTEYDKDKNFQLSKVITKSFLKEMSPEKIEKFVNGYFTKDEIDRFIIKQNALESCKKEKNALMDSHIEKCQDLAKIFGLDGVDYSNEQALDYQNQANALLGDKMRGKYKDMMARIGSFDKNNISKSVTPEMQSFMQAYADSFMSSNNLPSIKIETFFDAQSGQFGGYNDNVDSHKIRLNVAKFTSASEMMQTLSHELTHAVDSSLNKINHNDEDGYGLSGAAVFDDDEKIKNMPNDVRALVDEIDNYCYKLDPNERRGRIGELSGILFLADVAKDDERTKRQIAQSLKNFESYQKGIIRAFNELKSNKLKEFRELAGQLNNSSFNSRLNYLENIMKSEVDFSAEEKSLQEAERIKQELGIAQAKANEENKELENFGEQKGEE